MKTLQEKFKNDPIIPKGVKYLEGSVKRIFRMALYIK